MPSITELLNHISVASRGTLIVEKVENIGGHYARTLRLWREAFLTNFETKIRPALKKQHPNMEADEIRVFQRKWEVGLLPSCKNFFDYCRGADNSLCSIILPTARLGLSQKR